MVKVVSNIKHLRLDKVGKRVDISKVVIFVMLCAVLCCASGVIGFYRM